KSLVKSTSGRFSFGLTLAQTSFHAASVATKPVLSSGFLSLATLPWYVSRIGSCSSACASAPATITNTHAVRNLDVPIGVLRERRELRPVGHHRHRVGSLR